MDASVDLGALARQTRALAIRALLGMRISSTRPVAVGGHAGAARSTARGRRGRDEPIAVDGEEG
jgi:hypothetical protein